MKVYHAPTGKGTKISEIDSPAVKLEKRTMRRYLKVRCREARKAS